MIKTRILLWKTMYLCVFGLRVRVRVWVRFLLFYSELATHWPVMQHTPDFTWMEKYEEEMSDKYPHQFGICEFWEKCTRQLRNIRMFKSNVNHFYTILSYTISETISWAKNEMGHYYGKWRKMAGSENK